MNIGLVGELEVEKQLALRGWHPVRLDTAQMAANADLLALSKLRRTSIQVKTTDGGRKHSHSHSIGFGYSTGYLRDGRSIFNSKDSPLLADVVVGVNYKENGSRFIVMPVGLAENLCQRHCDYWFAVPTSTTTGVRSHSFPIYLPMTHCRQQHLDHDQHLQRHVLRFEDRWDLLDLPSEELHSRNRWSLEN